MKHFSLRTLTVYLLLVLLPLQGFAATGMSLCAPGSGLVSASPHPHVAKLESHCLQLSNASELSVAAAGEGKSAVDQHDLRHPCKANATCCTGFALPTSIALAVFPKNSPVAFSSSSASFSSVLSGTPERPPKLYII